MANEGVQGDKADRERAYVDDAAGDQVRDAQILRITQRPGAFPDSNVQGEVAGLKPSPRLPT